MNQQINLYQPIFRKQEKVFSAVAILQVLGIFLFMLLSLYGYSFTRVQKLEAQLAEATNSVNNIKASIATLAAGNEAPSALLEQEVKKLAIQVEQKKRIAEVLSKGSFSNTSGFSSHLEALAKQHIKGTWLTKINLGSGGSSMELKGASNAPELVPQYLKALMEESAFSSITFNIMDMQQSVSNQEQILFFVSTDKASETIDRFSEKLEEKKPNRKSVAGNGNNGQEVSFNKEIIKEFVSGTINDNE